MRIFKDYWNGDQPTYGTRPRTSRSVMVGGPPASFPAVETERQRCPVPRPLVVMPGLVPLLSGSAGLDRVRGVGRGGLPAHRPGRDTDCGAPATPAFARLPPSFPRRHLPPSWPDLFRPSTSRGIAVRAGRGRGGGPAWIPGTSPGMTGEGCNGGAGRTRLGVLRSAYRPPSGQSYERLRFPVTLTRLPARRQGNRG